MKLKFDVITEDGSHYTIPSTAAILTVYEGDQYIMVGESFEREGTRYKVEHLRQFTGRTDANSREIYDGDILETHMASGRRLTGVMQWVNSRSGWAEFLPRSSWRVIGNIYDNPEMLESVA